MLRLSLASPHGITVFFKRQVPNIRFNVAKELESVAPVCGLSSYESQIVPILSLLMEDTDRDVRFYAEKTSKALEDVFSNQ